jgi:hypothetical protein
LSKGGHFTTKDIAVIAVFSALASVTILLTNVINLVALSGIPGANAIYVGAISCFVIWIGTGAVSKFGGITSILMLNAVIENFLPGGPGAMKPLLIPSSLAVGLIVDLLMRWNKKGAESYLNGMVFGALDGLSVILVQVAFGIPLFSGSIAALLGWTVVGLNVVGHIVGAALSIPVIRRLRAASLISGPVMVKPVPVQR